MNVLPVPYDARGKVVCPGPFADAIAHSLNDGMLEINVADKHRLTIAEVRMIRRWVDIANKSTEAA